MADTDASSYILRYDFINSTLQYFNGADWYTAVSMVTPGITQLTGNVTAGPGSGSQVATIANGVILPAMITSTLVDFTFPRSVTIPGTMNTGNLTSSNVADLTFLSVGGFAPIQLQTSTWPSTIDVTFFDNQGIDFITSGSTQTLPTSGPFAAQAGLTTVQNDSTSTGNLVVDGITLTPGTAQMFQWNSHSTTWVPIGSSGSGTPAGSDTQVQFNNAGSFGADASFTWAAGALTVNRVNTAGLNSDDGALAVQIFDNQLIVQPSGGNDSQSYFLLQDSATNTIIRGDTINDNVAIGPIGLADPSSRLDVQSTTSGFLPPRMTTTQKNAIASPAEGLMVYDTTLHKLSVFTGSVWETVTSV